MLYLAKINVSYYVNVEAENERAVHDELFEMDLPERDNCEYVDDSFEIDYIEPA